MENKGWKTRDTSCPFSFLFQGSPSRVFCLRTFYLFLRIRDTTLKRTREGGSLCFLCPVRSFPHGSLKRTLKRKGKHTKTNSYPLKENPSREGGSCPHGKVPRRPVRGDTKSIGRLRRDKSWFLCAPFPSRVFSCAQDTTLKRKGAASTKKLFSLLRINTL